MKKLFVLFFLAKTFHAGGQENDLPNNTLTPGGIEVLKHVWKASWIRHPAVSLTDHSVLLFRKKSHLDKIPQRMSIYVSAITGISYSSTVYSWEMDQHAAISFIGTTKSCM